MPSHDDVSVSIEHALIVSRARGIPLDTALLAVCAASLAQIERAIAPPVPPTTPAATRLPYAERRRLAREWVRKHIYEEQGDA